MAGPPALPPVAALAPQAHDALARAWAAAREALDPALHDALRRRVEAQLGDADGGAGPGEGLAAHALALADQFVLYVPAVDEAHLAPLRARLGDEGLRTLVEALYVLDQAARLRLAHARLFDPAEFAPSDPVAAGAPPPLREALSDLHAAAMRLDRLDPLTTELVRLRCADYHDCAT